MCKSSSNKSLNQTKPKCQCYWEFDRNLRANTWAENGFEQVPGAFYFKLVISLFTENMMEMQHILFLSI